MSAADHIAAQSSLNASEKFLDTVKSAYRKIADMPGIGVLRDYKQSELKGMRMWRVSKYPRYLIFYVTTGTDLIILRVLHGSKDIDATFNSLE
jgi:toxin ParE1/3/4